MGRRLTHYTQPSIADRLATAPTIEQLAQARELLAQAHAEGDLTPEPRTVMKWHAAVWTRVFGLLDEATTADDAAYLLNATLRWPCPPDLRAELEARAAVRIRQLPPRAA